jgi:hypothetical protein
VFSQSSFCLRKPVVAFRSAKVAINPRRFRGAKGDNQATALPQASAIIAEAGVVATVNVSLSDRSLAVRGSKVLVHGQGIRGPIGRCQAEDITVTLLDPLPEKKPGKK